MKSVSDIEQAIEKIRGDQQKLRQRLGDLDRRLLKLLRELTAEQLRDHIGAAVIPFSRGYYPDWDRSGAVLIEVKRTRCIVQLNDGGKWDVPVYDVLLAADQAKQGFCVSMSGGGR